MKTTECIWVVAADGVHARFFAIEKDLSGLVPAGPGELKTDEEGKRSSDLKSDKPGRSFASSGGGVRHSIEPHHDYHKMEKHKFTVKVAHALDEAAAQRAFDGLILVAPKRSLGELRVLLSERVKGLLRQEVGKDLMASSPTELWNKLAPTVRSALLHAPTD